MAKISLDKVSDTRQKASIFATEEETLSAEKKAFNKIQKEKKVDGFRQGKIPENIIKTRFSKEIETETLNTLIHDLYPEILEKSSKNIFRIVNVENYSKDKNSCKFDLIFDLSPYMKNLKMKNIVLLDNIPQIQESDIDDELKDIQRGGAKSEPKAEDACAEDGDLITVNYEVWMDGAPQGKEQKDIRLLLGEKKFDEEVEEQIIKEKIKKGEEILVKKTLKQDGTEDKEEKPYEIHLSVTGIEKVIYPEINDELARAYSPQFNTVSELKNGLRKDMEKRFFRKDLTEQIAKAFDDLETQNEFLFPEGYLEEKLYEFLSEYKVDHSKLPPEQKKGYADIVEKRYRRILLNEHLVRETIKHFKKDELEKEFENFVRADFDEKIAEYVLAAYKNKKNDETLNKINLFFQNKLIFDYFKSGKLVKKGKKIAYKEFMAQENKPS
ncbi:MAG: trigger factor [Spirochaetia bacterium]|nr:trigger factor [Spirochaetia bacterium]